MIKGKIEKYLMEILELTKEEAEKINSDSNLLNYGFNSLGAIKMVVKFEEEYGIEIEPDDMLMSNMDNMDKILDLLRKYGIKE